MTAKMIPRNDRVLCRIVKIDLVRGMIMPDISQEGSQYIVEAVGPLVTDIKVGDKVLASGIKDVHWGFVPGHSDLFVIGEKDIPLIYVEEAD